MGNHSSKSAHCVMTRTYGSAKSFNPSNFNRIHKTTKTPQKLQKPLKTPKPQVLKKSVSEEFQSYAKSLQHASGCENEKCQVPHCQKIKKLLSHKCEHKNTCKNTFKNTPKNTSQNTSKNTLENPCKNCLILHKLVKVHSETYDIQFCNPTEYCKNLQSKLKAINEARTRLDLILHARSCQNTNCNEICRVAKQVISHAECCDRIEGCNVPFCLNTKQLMQHYDNCVEMDCSICSGFRKNMIIPVENSEYSKDSIVFETVTN